MAKRKKGLGWLAVAGAVVAASWMCASCASTPSASPSTHATTMAAAKTDQAASEQLFRTITLAQIKKIMEEEGYAVRQDKPGAVTWMIDGYAAAMIVDPKDGNSLQFYAGFSSNDVKLEAVNEWNKSKRYSRGYIDNENNPCLELDLDLEGGVTRERIADFLRTCYVSFARWCDEVVK